MLKGGTEERTMKGGRGCESRRQAVGLNKVEIVKMHGCRDDDDEMCKGGGWK